MSNSSRTYFSKVLNKKIIYKQPLFVVDVLFNDADGANNGGPSNDKRRNANANNGGPSDDKRSDNVNIAYGGDIKEYYNIYDGGDDSYIRFDKGHCEARTDSTNDPLAIDILGNYTIYSHPFANWSQDIIFDKAPDAFIIKIYDDAGECAIGRFATIEKMEELGYKFLTVYMPSNNNPLRISYLLFEKLT